MFNTLNKLSGIEKAILLMIAFVILAIFGMNYVFIKAMLTYVY